jgi:hypothetical protein
MHSLRTTLSSLPSTLDETYTQILDKIDAADWPQVYHILQCVCFSLRPLRIEELAAIFQLGDHAQPQFRLENALFFPEHILDVCSGLLSMSMVKATSWESNLTFNHVLDDTVIVCTVQLSHFTVKEYLISRRASFWHLDEQESHVAIIRTVTMYYILVASMPDFRSLSPQDILIKHSLAMYAAAYTWTHLNSIEPREHPDLLESFKALLNPYSALLANPIGSRYLWDSGSWEVCSPTDAPALSLCVAARLGVPQISKWLLTFGICRDQLLSAPALRDFNVRPPLSEAAYWGRLDVVEVLLGAGANTDAKSMGDAIYCAASGASGKVLQALVNAGGDPNTTRPDGRTVLWEAVIWGHADIVEILINAGANVNVVCTEKAYNHESNLGDDGGNGVLWRYQSVLSLARKRGVYDGPAEIVKLLEDAGATDVDYLALEAD